MSAPGHVRRAFVALLVLAFAACTESRPTEPKEGLGITGPGGSTVEGSVPRTPFGLQAFPGPVEGATALVAPPPFTASPFADAFVITGGEFGNTGDHYFPSNGDGTFAATSLISGLDIVDGTDVADMDGDGDLDFLTCDGSSGEVTLFTNNGGGSFSTSIVATGVTPSDRFCTNLRVADFDEDGVNDFVVGQFRTGASLNVYLQTSPGTFTKGPTLDRAWAGGDQGGVAAGDVNGDGHEDVVAMGGFSKPGDVRAYFGDGTGAMSAPSPLFNVSTDFGAGATFGITLFDIDGDGDLDVAAGGGGDSAPHWVYTNDGTGNFTKPASAAFSLPGSFAGVEAYDFDDDGDHDLVVVSFIAEQLFYVENVGGVLAVPVLVATLTGPSFGIGAPPLIDVIEVDNDGDGTPNRFDECPNDFGPPDNAGCPRSELPPGTNVSNPPADCPINVDGRFGSNGCIEWADVTPIVELGGQSVVYQAIAPGEAGDGLEDLYLMYDCICSANQLDPGQLAAVVTFFVGLDRFDVTIVQGEGNSTGGLGDQTTVLKNGVPFDAPGIEGAVDFNFTSPNFEGPHNLVELEVPLLQTPETPGGLPAEDGGIYSPDPSFWGAQVAGSPLIQVSSNIIDLGNGSTTNTTVIPIVTASFDGLCALVQSLVSHAGVANSMCAKIQAAERADARGRTNARDGSLSALIAELEAQKGKQLDADHAAVLIAIATALMT